MKADSSLPLLGALAFLGLWYHNSGLCLLLHIAIFLVSLCLCISLPGRTSVIMDWGHALLQNDFILMNYLCNNHFQIRQHSEVLAVRTAIHLLERYSSTHNSGLTWVDCPGKALLGGDLWAEPEIWESLGEDHSGQREQQLRGREMSVLESKVCIKFCTLKMCKPNVWLGQVTFMVKVNRILGFYFWTLLIYFWSKTVFL